MIHIVVFGALILGITGAFAKEWTASGFSAWWAFIFSTWPLMPLRTAKVRQTGEALKDPIEA